MTDSPRVDYCPLCGEMMDDPPVEWFTKEDVRLIRNAYLWLTDSEKERLIKIADKIEALLPPDTNEWRSSEEKLR